MPYRFTFCLLAMACVNSHVVAQSSASDSADYALEDVVITGTLKPVSVSRSPVKIDVVSADFMQQQLPVTNLVDGVALINGLQEVTACGVCYTNSISINGLPGAYTAVLIDGMPLYGNLASVYGLNGLPVTIIDRVEVIKGPSSTLYGSEAMAGVVNVITKSPDHQGPLSLDLMATSHGEAFLNANTAFRTGKGRMLFGVNGAYMNTYADDNGDGFGDLPAMDRWSLFGKWERPLKQQRTATVSGRLYYEDRRNGVESYIADNSYRSLRGSDSVYGESIYTLRAELFGQVELPHRLRLDYSASWHDQDSYYGADHYLAKQAVGFSNLIWNPAVGKHDIVAGLTNRYQFYDDNTVATQSDAGTNVPEHQYIPGVFVQDEWSPADEWTILTGFRLDHYQAHGLIPAPRLSIKYSPTLRTTFRANAGTGFRIVNLFTEDHAFITGQREVVITEALNPERSWTGTVNIHQLYDLERLGGGSLDLDAHFTHFSNKINPDYDNPGQIIYANSEGFTRSYGLSLQWDHAWKNVLSANLGATWMRVRETEPDASGRLVSSPVPFAAEWTGVFTLNWNPSPVWTIAYTAQLTGPMALPEVFDVDDLGDLLPGARSQRSRAFSQHHLRIGYHWDGPGLECYGGVTNAFDFRQPVTPLSGFNDPNFAPGFSPWFDTAYSYAPIHGRELFVGIRWEL